jgi:hydroxymethylpyrimidine pyrophosphatase-like HAD family hydrolase
MPDIALLATDLDGTLLRSDSTLSPRTRAALAAARGAGVRVVLATARPARVVDEIFGVSAQVADGHDLLDAAICGNGAVRYDLVARSLALTHPLAPDVATLVMTEIRRLVPGVSFAAETGHRTLLEPGYTYRPSLDWERYPVQTPGELVAQPLVKLLALLPGGDPGTAWARLRPSLGDIVACTWSAGLGATDRSYPAILEISAPGVSKAAALAELCTQWSIDRTQVVAVGDAPNDLPMLAWAGRAYAVANAHPDVLALTPHHLPGNDEDGVAHLLERLLGRSPATGERR